MIKNGHLKHIKRIVWVLQTGISMTWLFSSALIGVGDRSMHSCCPTFGEAKTDIKAHCLLVMLILSEKSWWLLNQRKLMAGYSVYKSTLSPKMKYQGIVSLAAATKNASRCLMRSCNVVRSLCVPPLSAGLDCVPVRSSWTLQGGLPELACSRTFQAMAQAPED